MKKVNISEQREDNFLNEYFGLVSELQERANVDSFIMHYFIELVCELPEVMNVKLDKDDLWSILEYTIWYYNQNCPKPIIEKAISGPKGAKMFLVPYVNYAFIKYKEDGTYSKKPKKRRVRKDLRSKPQEKD